MQFACQVAALVLAHLLQVVGQFGQGSGAFPHQAFQPCALAFQNFLLPLGGALQGVGLAQVHVKRQQPDGSDGRNAQAGEHQRLLDLSLACADADSLLLDQCAGQGADGIHVFLAHVGGQHELPGVIVALASQAQAQFHFGELSPHLAREFGKLRHVCGFTSKNSAQLAQVGVDCRHCPLIGFQVGLVAGEQVTAVAGFCVQHVLQQFVEQCTCILHMCHVHQRLVGALVAGLVDAHQGDGCQHCQWQTEGEFAQLGPAPGACGW